MEILSIEQQLEMKYEDYVIFLMKKYGIVHGNYFLDETCKLKNNKITRTKDGLSIHHIAECLIVKLSDQRVARTQPFEYQKADMLVYANLIEHLLLHIKITEEFNGKFETVGSVGIGGILFILRQINDYFGKLPELPSGWELDMYNTIKDNYSDYIEVLKYIHSSNDKCLKLFSIRNLASGRNGEVYTTIMADITEE